MFFHGRTSPTTTISEIHVDKNNQTDNDLGGVIIGMGLGQYKPVEIQNCLIIEFLKLKFICEAYLGMFDFPRKFWEVNGLSNGFWKVSWALYLLLKSFESI